MFFEVRWSKASTIRQAAARLLFPCLDLLNGALKYSWGAMNQVALKSLPL
jgi:hypothetical protein